MAVIVTKVYGTAGGSDQVDRFDAGRVAVVHEARLYVLARQVNFANSQVQDILAIYADGQWKSATVKNESE